MNKKYLLSSMAIIVLATILRLHNLGGTSLWFDEAVYATNANAPFSEFLHKTRTINSSPIILPLAFWILGDSIQTAFWIRFLPMVFGVLVVVVVLFLPRVGVSAPLALFSALWMAVLPMQVHYSQEVREYSLAAFIGILLVFCFLRRIQLPQLKRDLLFPFVLFLAPLCSYGTIFLSGTLLGLLFLLEFTRGEVRVGRYIAPVGALALSLLISYLVTAKYQMGIGKAWYLSADYPPAEILSAILWFAKSNAKYFIFQYGGIFPALFCLGSIGMFLLIALKKKAFQFIEFYIVMAFMLLVAGSITLSILGLYPYGGLRQHLFASPLAILAAAASFLWLVQNYKHRRILIGVFFVFVVLSSSIQGLPIAYRDQQNITSPIGDIPTDIEDSMVFVYYGAVPAVRFHFPDRNFSLSKCATGRLDEMENEVRDLGVGKVALVFAHMSFHEDHELVKRLLQDVYLVVVDKPYAGSQEGYPGSRLVVLEVK
jgi:uncharacterized membrane protein